MIRSITKKEWRFVLIIAVGVIVITAVPYLYGYFTTPRGMVYTGIHYLTPGDTNVYLSMIEQVKQGHVALLNLYTSEHQYNFNINPFWLGIGLIGKIFHLSNLLTFHVARSIMAIFFIIVLYVFISYFVTESKKRKWITSLIVFSSGLGLFFVPFFNHARKLYEQPIDTWVPESIPFLTMFHSPHQTASLALIVLIFLLMLLAFNLNKIKYSLWAGVIFFFLLWFHPFNGPTIFGALGVYCFVIFFRDRKIYWNYIKHLCILAVIALPAVIYLFLIQYLDWTVREWNKQNILPSPSVWMYIIGFGLIFFLAIPGLWITLKKGQDKGIFLASWVVSSAMLLYFPIYFQRRLSEGLFVPLGILAGLAIFAWAGKLKKNDRAIPVRQYSLIIFLLIFLPLTNFQLISQDIQDYHQQKDLPYYLYTDEERAMFWLRDNAKENEIIFSSFYMGNFIPAYSGRRVWIGHSPQTADLENKLVLNDWFWKDNLSTQEKELFLRNNKISYLYYGRKEKEIGSYDPDTQSYLNKVFSTSQAGIYKVQ